MCWVCKPQVEVSLELCRISFGRKGFRFQQECLKDDKNPSLNLCEIYGLIVRLFHVVRCTGSHFGMQCRALLVVS